MVKENSPISEEQNQNLTDPLSSAASQSLRDLEASLDKELVKYRDCFSENGEFSFTILQQ